MATQYTIGLDLGGTKLASALVDSRGKICARRKNWSPKSGKALTEMMADQIESLIAEVGSQKVKAIGLAAAGPLDVNKGCLLNATHFRRLRSFPIVDQLSKELRRRKLKQKVYFQNDAMAAALGEFWLGAAKNLKTFAVITLGTGIGSGVFYEGQPLQSQGMGGEWGLHLISHGKPSTGGNSYHGSVEGIASGKNIVRRAKELGFRGNSLEELLPLLRKKSNPYAVLFQEAASALAILCHNLSMSIRPEKILFTGGMMHASPFFFADLKSEYHELMRENRSFECKITRTKLKFDSGLIGAARLPALAQSK